MANVQFIILNKLEENGMSKRNLYIIGGTVVLAAIISICVWYSFTRYSFDTLKQNTTNYMKQNYSKYYGSQKIKGKNHQYLYIKFNEKFESLDNGNELIIAKDIQNYFEDQWDKLGIKGDILDDDYSNKYEPTIQIDTKRYSYTYDTFDHNLNVEDKKPNKKLDDQLLKDADKNMKSVSSSSSTTEIDSTENDDNTDTLSEDDKMLAYTYAQNYVKDQLKSPSSAKFPTYEDSFVTMTGDTVRVSAYVDADNSFGANIRTNFTVKMDEDNNLQDISMDDN